MSKKNNNVAVIDLFCGIGGLSHGFVKEDFKVVAGIDIDETCKYSFEANNNSTFISKSVSDISKEEINKLFGKTKHKILVGCAPCQPFSSYTFKDG
jgi:DNA (cytosine-5)-methyltransferase 1